MIKKLNTLTEILFYLCCEASCILDMDFPMGFSRKKTAAPLLRILKGIPGNSGIPRGRGVGQSIRNPRCQ